MKLTKLMKAWAIEKGLCTADSTDDEFKQAISGALVDGTLTSEKFNELSIEPEEKEAEDAFTELGSKLDTVAKSLEALVKLQATSAKETEPEPSTEEKAEKSEAPETKKVEQPSEIKRVLSVIAGDVDAKDGSNVRVKGAWEKYNDTKSAAIYPSEQKSGRPHPLAGERMKNQGRPMDTGSELDMALAGAYAKFRIAADCKYKSNRTAFQSLDDESRELLMYSMQERKWCGGHTDHDDEHIRNRKLTDLEMKALIDDGGASGGLEAAPIVFDDMVIQTPLLHGELYPLVNEVSIDRGRRVEGVVVGTVTGSWGGVDDTDISLFNTASYVSAFDTTIFRWEGAIHVGLDFMSDTPIDFGTLITTQYGERLLEDLDDVIADGNGTTQPEGIIQKSGTTTVNFGGSTSLGNYESLRFGVAKPEHRGNLNQTAVFCGTETSYQRARAIPVGASDARRLGGMDYSSYMWMERPYKINETLTNQEIFYAVMGRYRMYRRRGFTTRQSTEGDTLIRKNALLIVAMARYGGALERGACAAKTSTAPA